MKRFEIIQAQQGITLSGIVDYCGCTTGSVCEKHKYLTRRYHYDTAGNMYITDQHGNTVYEHDPLDDCFQSITRRVLGRIPLVTLPEVMLVKPGSAVLFAIVVWCAMAAAKNAEPEKIREFYE